MEVHILNINPRKLNSNKLGLRLRETKLIKVAMNYASTNPPEGMAFNQIYRLSQLPIIDAITWMYIAQAKKYYEVRVEGAESYKQMTFAMVWEEWSLRGLPSF